MKHFIHQHPRATAVLVIGILMVVLILVIQLAASRADGSVRPDPTNLSEMERTYHCGSYFHDWKDWQKHVRGFILYRDSSPVVYTHVAGRMSDYHRYDHLIVSLCTK